jgi:hypothetical protein
VAKIAKGVLSSSRVHIDQIDKGAIDIEENAAKHVFLSALTSVRFRENTQAAHWRFRHVCFFGLFRADGFGR